jgi:hypothetical protein
VANPAKQLIQPTRSCGECTECCSGTLVAEQHGHSMQRGRPCFFVSNKGCTIYKDRPEHCQKFKCEWLAKDYLPMWMRPDLSKVIVVQRDGFVEVSECEQKIDSAVLSWLMVWAANSKTNIRYEVAGGWNWINFGNHFEQVPNPV